ncbi:hypothetical protein SAMN05444157_0673 [Frankineae bacterium MT45]|nr:hypothetical protein SAMN05444157_0673 [Frankineae bacterium MT45]
MTSRTALVDTAVLAYAIGGAHELKAPCAAIIAAAGNGEIELHASVEMMQELLFHRLRRGSRTGAVAQARDAGGLCRLHDFDQAVLAAALGLVERVEGIGGRDAVHAATALVHGISTIISPDRAFDVVPGLRRVSPEAGVKAIP